MLKTNYFWLNRFDSMDGHTFELEDIFDKEFLSSLKSDKNKVRLKPRMMLLNMKKYKTVISSFCEATNLTYIENNKDEGNLCFAKNPDIRNEFKSGFSLEDVVFYIVGQMNECPLTQTIQHKPDTYPTIIPYPLDADYFWKMSTKGRTSFSS